MLSTTPEKTLAHKSSHASEKKDNLFNVFSHFKVLFLRIGIFMPNYHVIQRMKIDGSEGKKNIWKAQKAYHNQDQWPSMEAKNLRTVKIFLKNAVSFLSVQIQT